MSMQKGLIPLKEVVYESKARDGTWCTLPYPGHPHGCKNFPQCPLKYPDFKELQAQGYNDWSAVMIEFDRQQFGIMMRSKHPKLSKAQSECLLYWQPEVRRKLREKAYSYANKFNGDKVLEIPEACGINVIVTMIKAGVKMEVKDPKIVRKVMFIGRKNY